MLHDGATPDLHLENSAPKTYSEDATRSGCRGVGVAEPVGCFKVRLLRHARSYQFELTSVIRGENCLMLALVVPPFSYPHHSPQRWHSSREPMGTHCAGLRSKLIACSAEFKTPSFNINEPITTSEVTTGSFTGIPVIDNYN